MPTEGWDAILKKGVEVLEQEAARRAQLLRNEMVENLSHAGKGREYTQRFAMIGGKLRVVGKRDKPHRASAPGHAPAVDGGQLRQSIVAVQVKKGHWRVGTTLEYGVFLEFGTRNMAPRPFIRTAVEAARNL